MNVQTLDVISVNLWSILISLANLALIFWIVKKFLFKPIKAMLTARQSAVDSIYDKAEEARREAEENRSQYEAKLAAADEEASALLRAANERARRTEEEIVGEANRKAAATLKKADEDIAFEKKRALNELKNEITGISLDIAEKVIGREIREDDHKALIDGFIDEIDSEKAED
jgi:F-type H+-transporting ATPase subunit b